MDNNETCADSAGHRRSMNEMEEKERRASIQAIMSDQKLSHQERRMSIQSLMDGRRRSLVHQNTNGDKSSFGPDLGMAVAAAMAAADFVDSSDENNDDEEDEEGERRNARVHPLNQKKGSPPAAATAINKNNSENNTRERRKRSSCIFKCSSSNIAREKLVKRRASLRDSFTIGFAKMNVKNWNGDDTESFTSASARRPEPTPLSRKMEKSRPHCAHYDRNCSIVSPCCGLVFGCRICHNDPPVLPPPFLPMGREVGQQPTNMEEVAFVTRAERSTSVFAAVAAPTKTPLPSHRSASLPPNFLEDKYHHEIDRFLIKEVICRKCFTRQSSKTNNCVYCGIQFGNYHCATCNLWMSADDDPYHCLKCGFCRVGGRDNFTHCDDCGMCIDALLFEDHNCKSGKYMSNCPVCQEDLFSSRMACHEMPCGHAIHWHCFHELTSHDTRCPVCKKTVETHDQMEQTWNTMAMGVALQPVPAELARVVDILCNDCDKKSTNQRWHFLGVQCRRCTSFNTIVERTVLVGQQAANYLRLTSDVTAQAQWASGMADQNVLAALMGGGGGVGLPDRDSNNMDTEALNQSVAAEVMGIMNRNNQPPFSNSMEGDDEMQQSSEV